jgi:hypothetical protein
VLERYKYVAEIRHVGSIVRTYSSKLEITLWSGTSIAHAFTKNA